MDSQYEQFHIQIVIFNDQNSFRHLFSSTLITRPGGVFKSFVLVRLNTTQTKRVRIQNHKYSEPPGFVWMTDDYLNQVNLLS